MEDPWLNSHATGLLGGTLRASMLDTVIGPYRIVRLLGKGGCADTKNVTRTNFIDIGWSYDARTGRVILTSAEDNLGKGAGSQAVQSFNLIFGLPETAGLQTA